MTLAQEAVRALGGDWHGRYGLAPAPGHNPRDRGVSIRDSSDGRDIVINSFNGADWREVRDDLRARGLPLPQPCPGRTGDEWRETGLFEFADEAGEILYRTRRLEHPTKRKRFVAERPDGRGGWTAKLGDVRRVLYRLPELSAAIGRAALKDEALPLVYLTEGERKADKLAALGFLATAIAFGARGGIGREEYVEALRGCRVVILPDNDDEGRGFAEAARAALDKVGTEATILELPGLPDKGDVIDWSGTADELRQLTDAAFNPPAETFPIADLAAWARTDPQPKAFVMAGFIPRGEVTLLTGAGGANKSTFGLQLCACAAASRPMLGVHVEPGAAIYVTAEDDSPENHWRSRKIAERIGTTLDRLAGKLHIVSLRGRLNNELATFDGEGRLHVAPAFRLLRATIEATGSRLVVLDNVAHLFAGNENDHGNITAFINLLYQLCRDLGCTAVLVGHPNKAGDTYSGSTAWLNAVRSQIVLGRPEGNPDPDARVLSVGKANYARLDAQLAFRWHDFALVTDDELPDDVRAELAASAEAAHDNSLFIDCLAERTRQHRPVSERSGRNLAPVVFADMPESRAIGKARLERAMDRLFRTGQIERGFLWRDTAEGRDVHGLRLAANGPDTSANASANDPQTRSANDRNSLPQTTEITHPLSTREMGAAPWPAAPTPDQDDPDDPDDPANFLLGRAR